MWDVEIDLIVRIVHFVFVESIRSVCASEALLLSVLVDSEKVVSSLLDISIVTPFKEESRSGKEKGSIHSIEFEERRPGCKSGGLIQSEEGSSSQSTVSQG